MNKRPLAFLLSVLIPILLSGGGCARLFPDDPLVINIPPERLQNADPLDLRAEAEDNPLTLEQAKKNLESDPARPADEQGVSLSLAEVRAATLANNLDLQVQLVFPALSQTDVDTEEAKFEATFNASAFHGITDSPTAQASIQGTSIVSDRFLLGLNVPLRTGGTATINLPFNRVSTDNAASLSKFFTSDLSFGLSQPLLRGAGPRVNTHSIRVAHYNRQISEAQTKLEAMRILTVADKGYWQLYAAYEELEVRHQQYELAEKLRDQAQRKVNAGSARQIEVLRAESGLAARLEAIIISRTEVLRLERDLKRIMNREDLPLDSPTQLVLETESEPPVGLMLDAGRLADRAVENRMEMLEQELRLAIDASNLDFARNARLPLILLDYTYNINGLGSTFGDSFSQLNDKNFEDWSLSLSAEIPLGNERAKAGVHRAILQRIQRLATKQQRELSIRQEVFDAVDRLEQNWRRIVAASYASDLARRTYEAELRQFEVGQRTSTDVLDAATQLADAQSGEIRALTDYRIAEVDIAFATGTLLGSSRVHWEPVTVPED